jgi:hypothetical protein
MPVLGWLVWLAKLVVDVALHPASHNLFPLKIVIGTALAVLQRLLAERALSGASWITWISRHAASLG